MKLSVVIVSWNTADILRQCLESVFAHPPAAPFDVWVVDNASTDGTVAMVQQQFPQVNLLTNPHNVGFATANNQAMRQATGDYVLLLNPDTIVHAGALQTLVHFLDTHPQTGACGARLLNADGTLQHSCYPTPTLGRELLRMFHLDGRVRYHMEQWPTDQPRPVEALLGACILARRNLVEAIGWMDESFFMYSEEIDLCYRIARAGWQLHWVPQAEIVHLGGQSTRQVKTEMFLRLYQGKLHYMRKHYGRGQAELYKMILALAAWSRIGAAPLAARLKPANQETYQAIAGQYRQLIKQLPTY